MIFCESKRLRGYFLFGLALCLNSRKIVLTILLGKGSIMKKVVVITTGGTIAMKYDADACGLIPVVGGEDLTNAVPELKEFAEVEVVEFTNIPSGHMTPQLMLELSALVDEIAAREEVEGLVVTHGTDTLEETAYFLSITLQTHKSVCITGAMRGASEAGCDGPANILAAVRVAATEGAGKYGVVVVFDDEIHAAAEVTKTHTTSCHNFQSPGWGPIGHVYFDKVLFKRDVEKAKIIKAKRVVDDVYLLEVATGMDDYLFRCLAEKPIKGLVLQGLGCGNVPPGVLAGIELLLQKNIPVVLASRVYSGRVVPAYGYLGGGQMLKDMGIIFGEELSAPKIRLKLMLILAITKERENIKRYFE